MESEFNDTLKEYAKMMSSTEELHPELQPYFEENGAMGFPMLRHPLVYQVPFWSNGMANEQFRIKSNQVDEALRNGEFEKVVWLHERPYRVEAFIKIQNLLDDNTYWKLLGQIWTDTENGWANLKQWRELFGSKREKRMWLMDWDEQLAYESLADTVTVYRGCQPGLNEDGISWTLKRDKAEWFATRFSKEGIVLEKQISKRDIIAVFTGRNEFEAVIL
jgi:hypothetical protein